MPAQAAGVFSLRPSTGAISTDGMWSGVPYVKCPTRYPLLTWMSQWDTPCFLGRDLGMFYDFAEAWYAKDLPSLTNTVSSIDFQM
jgi:hypothetical protein